MTGPVISLRHVTAGYGKVPVLKDVSLDVEAGKLTVVLGPNGSGKSTLLRAVSGVVRVTEGEVLFEGVDVTNRTVRRLVHDGMLFQPESRELFPTMTVEENLFAVQSPTARASGRSRADVVLEAFPFLAENLRRKAAGLSGGEQQLVAIGRAIIGSPRVLLLDEPSLGLAPVMLQAMYAQLTKLQRELDLTILVAEQGVQIAREQADQVCVLGQGRIVHQGLRGELSDDRLLSAYFGS